MKNEPTVRISLDENTANDAESVISKNLERAFRIEASVYEIKFAHLRERANIIARALKAKSCSSNIMDALSHLYEAPEMYFSLKGEEFDFGSLFGNVNHEQAECLAKNSKRLDDLYICKSIASLDGDNYDENDIIRWLLESEEVVSYPIRDKKVSFVRGNQSGRAFECFAKYVPGVLAEYEEDFKSACEAVANGESTYAIVPVENSTDGRLNSFYRLIEKYALSIVLAADIPSDDYENSTKFALVYKSLDVIKANGSKMFEFKITFSEPRELGEVIFAAEYFGATVHKVYSLPLSSGGRENSFDIILDLNDANTAGLLCYLFLEYSQFTAVGIYTLMEA